VNEDDAKIALRDFDVSRETLDLLEAFVSELRRWNKKINLVSQSTLDEVWGRHILDSAQLVTWIPEESRTIMDIGTGGGFPGLVLSILGRDQHVVTLVDSDARKCAFLSHCGRALGLNIVVRNTRIDQLDPQSADVITSRALAPLLELLEFGARHIGPRGRLLLLKGRKTEDELKSAIETWRFSYQKFQSVSDPEASVLQIDAPFEKLS